MIRTTSLSRLFVSCLLLAALGCGDAGKLDKVVVEGSVSYDGAPVQNGEIRFHPIEGTLGPVSGGPIVDGRYRAVAKGGVPVGKHAVRIIGYETTGSPDDDMISAAQSGGGRVNYIPRKYNEASELTIDVTGDRKTMTHQDFELTK